MSDFTIGLAILGGLLLAALVAWNTWSSRRQAPRQAAQAVPRAPDHHLRKQLTSQRCIDGWDGWMGWIV